MILYKNMKVNVYSLDWDTDFFDILAGFMQGDALALYLFIIWLDYVIRMSINLMKENGFTLKKARGRWFSTETIMDADYADDIVLLTNTPSQAKSLLHNLEQAADDISCHVNAGKTKYMCFNQTGDISILNGGSLKSVDKFTYLGSSISSTENDINIWQAKTWTAINRLLIIWKSDLSDKIKCNFF